jgi:hypothetical protein
VSSPTNYENAFRAAAALLDASAEAGTLAYDTREHVRFIISAGAHVARVHCDDAIYCRWKAAGESLIGYLDTLTIWYQSSRVEFANADWLELAGFWRALEVWAFGKADQPCIRCAVRHGVYDPDDVTAGNPNDRYDSDRGCPECVAEVLSGRGDRAELERDYARSRGV